MQVNSQEVLTKDELVEWFLNPITKKVRFKIEKKIRECQEHLGNGWTLHRESMERTALETAELAGKVEGLEFIFEIEGD